MDARICVQYFVLSTLRVHLSQPHVLHLLLGWCHMEKFEANVLAPPLSIVSISQG